MKPFCKHGHEIAVVGRERTGSCKECKRIRQRERYARDPEHREAQRAKGEAWRRANLKKSRDASRRWKGMTEIPVVDAEPGHPCEICKRPIKGCPRADHDHTTGKFRGWLCNGCNAALGFVERPGWLDSATQYLSKKETP